MYKKRVTVKAKVKKLIKSSTTKKVADREIKDKERIVDERENKRIIMKSPHPFRPQFATFRCHLSLVTSSTSEKCSLRKIF